MCDMCCWQTHSDYRDWMQSTTCSDTHPLPHSSTTTTYCITALVCRGAAVALYGAIKLSGSSGTDETACRFDLLSCSLHAVDHCWLCLLCARSCIKRGWQRSTLIMSVPQTSASKGKVMLKEYKGSRVETEQIFRWMTSHVAHRIKTLHHSEQLVEEWRSDPAHPLKMFLFARLAQPPAFFSSLSVKFTGRIEFIFVDVRRWGNYSSLSEIGVTRSPAYILKMPEGIYHYGNRWWLLMKMSDFFKNTFFM